MLGIKANSRTVQRATGTGDSKSRPRSHDGKVVDLSRVPYMTFGHGVQKNNPKVCIICRKPIKHGDDWRKYASEEDPRYGRYSVIVHSHCV